LAHTELVATLAGNVPHPIYAEADSDDLSGPAPKLSADALRDNSPVSAGALAMALSVNRHHAAHRR
jgi:hypothetical protein